MSNKQNREKALARITKTLATMKRVSTNDDVHADAYVRDVTELLKLEADAYAARAPAGERVAELLASLTDEQRMELFDCYCKSCGKNDPSCQCWNDE